ncbi:MAG TPA: nucleotidyltransferase domain-containing protein [Anaerolineales bacterium]|jgi:predicted nucleotidyltransferase|nr:nucleotidyltransferase domain-containing protein [Anaerolineales bacterium]
MVAQDIVGIVQNYLRVVAKKGVPVRYGVLFGSYAKGKEHKWSDIDLLVVSPLYDKKRTYKQASKLWRIAAHTDSRIEPIPVGEKQYKEDDSSLIIEVARREGQIIPLAE